MNRAQPAMPISPDPCVSGGDPDGIEARLTDTLLAGPAPYGSGPSGYLARLLDDGSRTPWIALPVLAFVIAFIQSAVVLRPSAHLVSDMGGYLDRGRALALGAAFRPYDLFFPPGTGYFLAGLFKLDAYLTGGAGNGFPVLLLSALWSLCIALGTLAAGLLSSALFPASGAAVAAMILSACYWPMAALASFLMSEPLFIGTAIFGYALICREILGKQRVIPAVCGSLLLGAGCLVRTQGVLLAASVGFAFLMVARARRCDSREPRELARTALLGVSILAALLLPILLHLTLVSRASGSAVRFIAANDAFNLYLGQSRRGGVGALDPKRGEYYLFFNNNSGGTLPFEPFEAVPGAITDRSLFFSRTFSLWQEDVSRQIVRSLENLRELFLIRPSWPLTAFEPQYTRVDLVFQWLAVLLGIIPAIGMVLKDRQTALVIGAPLMLLSVSAAATTGQPRYLTPFLLIAFAGASPVLAAMIRSSSPGLRAQDAVSALQRGMLVVLLACGASFGIELLYSRYHPPLAQVPLQARYELSEISPPPTPLGVQGWFTVSSEFRRRIPSSSAEIGYEDLRPLRVAPGVSLTSSGFERKQEITPRFSAQQAGTIAVTFPASAATHLAFFLLDPDKQDRIVALRAGSVLSLGQQLFPGKWVSIALSAEERVRGSVTVELRPLQGPSVELSAVILYRADTDLVPAAGPRPTIHATFTATEVRAG